MVDEVRGDSEIAENSTATTNAEPEVPQDTSLPISETAPPVQAQPQSPENLRDASFAIGEFSLRQNFPQLQGFNDSMTVNITPSIENDGTYLVEGRARNVSRDGVLQTVSATLSADEIGQLVNGRNQMIQAEGARLASAPSTPSPRNDLSDMQRAEFAIGDFSTRQHFPQLKGFNDSMMINITPQNDGGYLVEGRARNVSRNGVLETATATLSAAEFAQLASGQGPSINDSQAQRGEPAAAVAAPAAVPAAPAEGVASPIQYRNEETFAEYNEVSDISPDNLFVSEDNCAFDTNELTEYFNSTIKDKKNPHTQTPFTKNDLEGLSKKLSEKPSTPEINGALKNINSLMATAPTTIPPAAVPGKPSVQPSSPPEAPVAVAAQPAAPAPAVASAPASPAKVEPEAPQATKAEPTASDEKKYFNDETLLGDPVSELAAKNDLFVSESNHAFSIEELKQSFAAGNKRNPYTNLPFSKTDLENFDKLSGNLASPSSAKPSAAPEPRVFETETLPVFDAVISDERVHRANLQKVIDLKEKRDLAVVDAGGDPTDPTSWRDFQDNPEVMQANDELREAVLFAARYAKIPEKNIKDLLDDMSPGEALQANQSATLSGTAPENTTTERPKPKSESEDNTVVTSPVAARATQAQPAPAQAQTTNAAEPEPAAPAPELKSESSENPIKSAVRVMGEKLQDMPNDPAEGMGKAIAELFALMIQLLFSGAGMSLTGLLDKLGKDTTLRIEQETKFAALPEAKPEAALELEPLFSAQPNPNLTLAAQNQSQLIDQPDPSNELNQEMAEHLGVLQRFFDQEGSEPIDPQAALNVGGHDVTTAHAAQRDQVESAGLRTHAPVTPEAETPQTPKAPTAPKK